MEQVPVCCDQNAAEAAAKASKENVARKEEPSKKASFFPVEFSGLVKRASDALKMSSTSDAHHLSTTAPLTDSATTLSKVVATATEAASKAMPKSMSVTKIYSAASGPFGSTSKTCLKPPSIVEFQLPIFHCLSTQLQEAQSIIQKLEAQTCEQDRKIRESAEAACKRERALELKLMELQKEANSAHAFGNAAKALESATSNINAKILEAQQLRQQLNMAEARLISMKEENDQMRSCLECMKTKMIQAEKTGYKSAKNWKLECEKLKSDICQLRSAADDFCQQLHEANRKCATLEGLQSRLKSVCDVSAASQDSDDSESMSTSMEISAGRTTVTKLSPTANNNNKSMDDLGGATEYAKSLMNRFQENEEGARYDDFGAGLGGVKEDKVQRHVPGGQFTSSTAPTSTQAAAAVGAMASKRLGNLQQSDLVQYSTPAITNNKSNLRKRQQSAVLNDPFDWQNSISLDGTAQQLMRNQHSVDCQRMAAFKRQRTSFAQPGNQQLNFQ
jgi:hypothetical protein